MSNSGDVDGKTFIVWDEETLAAVKFKGVWRFFVDMEIMFLLDYTAYEDYLPEPGEFRYGTLIVDDQNAEVWMNSMAKEIEAGQLVHLYWQNTDDRVRPTFVIDFDRKFWVGGGWSHDQSPLQDYQPKGWTALEDNVMKYLPDEISSLYT
ncbi:MAG: hypothetical protein GC204_21370 [Chloroflexi bacterium]|nr:hypothetical protein [Chloroflexota bacterium]